MEGRVLAQSFHDQGSDVAMLGVGMLGVAMLGVATSGVAMPEEVIGDDAARGAVVARLARWGASLP